MKYSEFQEVVINSRKYDGSLRRSWTCRLIEQNESSLVLVGEFDEDVQHPGLGEIKRGTISYEYYWLDRWYNVFCFYEPDSTFRNHYCNINMPPVYANGVLDYVDLDIDLVVWPDGTFNILDEAEFAENAVAFDYPDEIVKMSHATLTEVLRLARNQLLPLPM